MARMGVTSATRRSIIRVSKNSYRTRSGVSQLNMVRGKSTGFRKLSNRAILKGGSRR